MSNGLQIPIVKLTVDFMQTAILQALDPGVLADQLKDSTKKALVELDFNAVAKNLIIRLVDEAFESDAVKEPIREWLRNKMAVEIKELLQGREGSEK